MGGVEQAAVLGQAASMPGHLDAVAGGHHGLEVHPHLDAPAHEAGVDGVVIGVDPDVVISRQAGREAKSGIGQHRREAEHRSPVLVEELGRHRRG